MTVETKRRYDSSRRQEHAAQTRSAVVEAAVELFSSTGWASTGMRDIARRAGVSVETVYANFGSKGQLLMAALDVAVVGDARAMPMRERPEFAELGRGSAAARARAAARLVREVNERTSGVHKALREAASADAELAARLEERELGRRSDVSTGAALVAGRPVTTTEAEGLWAVLSTEVHELLIGHGGWTPEAYEEWVADTISRLLRPARKGRT
ncbi:MAG: TetR/AcrR family transcriptional regulator [Acidimicrobiia bacterium]|nr:TetR/AcrR family transcriptional regulator [Acidimicrobiia bacterium]